jgi:hypothetical protein
MTSFFMALIDELVRVPVRKFYSRQPLKSRL